ncbi:MAG: hypothetical protein ACPGJV_05295 [Bacteriovoracaceae bacterium]
MKTFFLTAILMLLSINTSFAGQCYGAFKQAKELEKIVQDVYLVSEGDDTWEGFASWAPISEINEKEIRKALRLGETYEGQEAYFSMEGHAEVYDFLRNEIESYSPQYYDDELAQEKLKNLMEAISQKYGKKVRLIMFGEGDGNAVFIGDHMIIMIDEMGCVLGLKALTVWT